ncbi:hypothetical protein J6590_089789 [Homalodisca vitripennis]|nr:hypothetical protein J6590_089789 [Homalodisca vitripennis]
MYKLAVFLFVLLTAIEVMDCGRCRELHEQCSRWSPHSSLVFCCPRFYCEFGPDGVTGICVWYILPTTPRPPPRDILEDLLALFNSKM